MDLQFPPEIVHKILLNLHRLDLLNSRLVSQTWNNESMTALTSNSKYLVQLNETNLAEYIEFSQQTKTPFIMPFQLNLTFGKTPSKQQQGQSPVEKFKETISKVETLVDIFGPTCVHDISFYFYANAQELIPSALKLLTQVSQGLKVLGVWIYVLLGRDPEEFFRDCPNLNLPKVERLFMYSKMDPNTTLWPKLAEKCPNLDEVQMLTFPPSLRDENWPVPMNLAKIKQLMSTGAIPLSSISNKLCNSPWLSNLTCLVFVINANFKYNQSDVTALQNMFEHLSKTLVDLRLIFHAYQYADESILMPCTTKFHRLKYLSVNIYMNSNVKCPTLMIDPSVFPNLETVTLPYCMKLELLASKVMDSNPDPFPKAKSLILWVRENLGLTTPINPYKDYMEGLENIFKHVTKVNVVNSSSDGSYENEQNGVSKIKYVLEGILTSAGANKITDLTLEDYQENYLGIVLNQIYKPPRLVVENLPRHFYLDSTLKKTFEKLTGCTNLLVIDQKENEDEGQDDKTIVVQQNPTHLTNNFNMWNLTNLRLVLNSWRKKAWNECFIPSNSADPTTLNNLMDTPRELYVKTLVKNFPLLEEIHVSSFMFGKDKKVRTQILQKITKDYPNIVIDLI